MFTIQRMTPDRKTEVANLIRDSTNDWYQQHLGYELFDSGSESTMLFCDVYESLDPGCCLIAVSDRDESILGSCFYHPRETHFSLGIMNVRGDVFGQGVARALLNEICELADLQQKPVRLVSSAMNLDSFSLYNRAGFVPRHVFQDMVLSVPTSGLEYEASRPDRIRVATTQDIQSMGDLEEKIAGIRRDRDYRFFVNAGAMDCQKKDVADWHVSVLYEGNELKGWLVSVVHPASCMVGPGIASDESTALTLLHHELNHRKGQRMVFLVPVECQKIIRTAYAWGARNCEIHLAQSRGPSQPFAGIVFPTFMPETG